MTGTYRSKRGQVNACPQRDDTPERVRAYTPEQIAAMRNEKAKVEGTK